MKRLAILLAMAGIVALSGCQSYRGGAEGPQGTGTGAGWEAGATNSPNAVPGVNPWQGTPAQWRGSQPLPP